MPTIMTQATLQLVEEGTPNSQRVAVLEKPGSVLVKHALIPEPGPGEVRVKIKYVGICGSDLEAYRGHRSPEFMSTPARLGHEVAGTVDMVGEGVVGLLAGDRVTCRYVWGAFAEYLVCKPFNVKRVPADRIPLLEVSLLEILPGVIHAAELARITPHTSVLITGQGVSGLVLTQIFRLYSPKVLAVTDLKDRNLELARAYGATHTYKVSDEHAATMDTVGKDFPGGFDVVVPCLLDGDGMKDALECISIGGRIVMYGCIGPCTGFDFFRLHRKRGEIYSTEPRTDIQMRELFDRGIRLAEDGLLDTGGMVTHIYPISRVDEAFRLRNDKSGASDAIHVLIDCEKNSGDVVVDLRATKAAGSGSGSGAGAVVAAASADDGGCCGGR